ncbi:hypothetical protein [Micromonospora sp. WMMD812]|uniref:hypothetical protein n=1 Tax=Micromonospora sp. WMMD812 TaxID=3015152 RepID=UPI00248CFB5B|nr:hypothetical protein [Micromonospora sp. WMMD812]WBB65571.1 hypothetical protein O7603_20505 [Micromonospora sp. WMMD812]
MGILLFSPWAGIFVSGLVGGGYEDELLSAGALLVIAGPLLRIEAAVQGTRRRGPGV